jgi:hypothetical protein
MTRTTTKPKRAQTTTSTPVNSAALEQLLDDRVRDLDPARWPAWARARYSVQHPAGEVIEPMRIDEAPR